MPTPSEAALPSPAGIIAFWRDAGPDRWFRKDPDFDRAFIRYAEASHLRAAARQLDDWNATPEGALALQLLLDQFPRNAWRDTAHAWATDPLAQHFVLQALDAGLDAAIEPALRQFCYMALMHAEDLPLQRHCVGLFEQLGGPGLPYARDHCAIIERFGRFPHRNRALGRQTTAEEQAFLDAGGFAG